MVSTKLIKRSIRIITLVLLLHCLISGLFVTTALGAEPGQVTLTIKQALTNYGSTTAPPSQTFTYRLAPKQASCPMPAGSDAAGFDFAITGTDSMNIGPLRFTNEGKYIYEVTQTTKPQPGYTLSREAYQLEIYIDNNLHAAVMAYNNDGTKAEDINFAHSFNLLPSDPKLMVDPPVIKTVAGNPPKDGVFTFKLTAGKKSNPMPAGSADGVKTIKIVGAGRKDFGTWSYAKEGIYYYKVSEVKAGASGYKYDTAIYKITDSVKAVGNQLVLKRVVTNSDNKPVTSMSFINKYTKNSKPDGPGNPNSPGKPGGSGTTVAPGNPGSTGKDGPKTGDDSQLTLYIVLLCASVITALGSAIYLLTGKRRESGSEEQEV